VQAEQEADFGAVEVADPGEVALVQQGLATSPPGETNLHSKIVDKVEKELIVQVLAALLLGAVVSAVLVVADRLVVNMSDGGLLLGWAVLWGLAFVALALLADTARALSQRTVGLWKRGAEPTLSFF